MEVLSEDQMAADLFKNYERIAKPVHLVSPVGESGFAEQIVITWVLTIK